MKAFKCTEVPGVMDGAFVVDEDTASSWAHGRSIKVVRAKKGVPCRWHWCSCAGVEQVQGELGMLEQEVPASIMWESCW